MKEKYGLTTHNRRFQTEEMCKEHLARVRWNGAPKCPKCFNDYMNYFLATREIYKCSKCKVQFSVIKNTVFEGSNISLQIWFKAIFFIVSKKRGLSSYQLAEWLEVEQRTAWFILHRLREALKHENDIKLSGIVEADETLVAPQISRDKRLQWKKQKHYEEQNKIHGLTEKTARRRYGPRKVGRKKGSTKEVLAQKRKMKALLGERKQFEIGVIVTGFLERNGRIVLKKIGVSDKDVTQNAIMPLLKQHVTADSILLTDESGIYEYVKDFFKGHQTVNHSKTYVSKDGTHINQVENAFNHFKRSISGTYFHLSKQHFSRYLCEYTFRWNRRNMTPLQRFDEFLPLVVGKRIKYIYLTSESSKLAA